MSTPATGVTPLAAWLIRSSPTRTWKSSTCGLMTCLLSGGKTHLVMRSTTNAREKITGTDTLWHAQRTVLPVYCTSLPDRMYIPINHHWSFLMRQTYFYWDFRKSCELRWFFYLLNHRKRCMSIETFSFKSQYWYDIFNTVPMRKCAVMKYILYVCSYKQTRLFLEPYTTQNRHVWWIDGPLYNLRYIQYEV